MRRLAGGAGHDRSPTALTVRPLCGSRLSPTPPLLLRRAPHRWEQRVEAAPKFHSWCIVRPLARKAGHDGPPTATFVHPLSGATVYDHPPTANVVRPLPGAARHGCLFPPRPPSRTLAGVTTAPRAPRWRAWAKATSPNQPQPLPPWQPPPALHCRRPHHSPRSHCHPVPTPVVGVSRAAQPHVDHLPPFIYTAITAAPPSRMPQ